MKKTLENNSSNRNLLDTPQIDAGSFYDGKKYSSTFVGGNQFRRTLRGLKTPENLKKKQQATSGPIQPIAQQPRVVFVETLGNFRGTFNNKGPLTKANSVGNFNNKGVRNSANLRKRTDNNKIDIATTINLFRTNVQKFEPLKKPEKKIPFETDSNRNQVTTNNEDTLFSGKDDAFLTAVNIEERSVKGNIEDIGESNIEPNEPNVDQNDQNIKDRDPTLIEPFSQEITGKAAHDVQQRRSFLPACVRIQNPLERVNSADKMFMKSSEENFKRIQRAKPKIYISAKANTVKAFGKPENKIEHMCRVLHKEGTPTVIYPLSPQFKSKKTLKKLAFEAYLVDYNPRALSIVNEEAFNMFYNLAVSPNSIQ